MWAAIRLLRATRVFAVIFLSYLWAMSWARLWPSRCDTSDRWKKINRRNARRMYRGFVSLRGVYIKLGQILATRADLFGDEIAADLASLQDRLPPFPGHQARALIEAGAAVLGGARAVGSLLTVGDQAANATGMRLAGPGVFAVAVDRRDAPRPRGWSRRFADDQMGLKDHGGAFRGLAFHLPVIENGTLRFRRAGHRRWVVGRLDVGRLGVAGRKPDRVIGFRVDIRDR